MMRWIAPVSIALAGLVAVGAPAAAQMPSALANAIRAGQVGERYDGYLGYATATTPVVQRQVGAINIQRRSLYSNLAQRRRVLPQDVGIAAGCELLARVPVGGVYLPAEGSWRRRGAGEAVARPDYCR